MPTHCNEEGMESTTELLKFKGEVCLYYNSLMKMKAVTMFKFDHVYEPTWRAKEGDQFQPLMSIAGLGLQVIGARKAG